MPAALFFDAPRQISVRDIPLPRPGPTELLIETTVSAVSAGSELLAYRGELPTDLPLDATIAALADQPAVYPLQYGYMTVGRVVDRGKQVEATWTDRLVFAFQPHATHFTASPKAVIPVPDGITPEDAVFLPNMETAVALVMDGRPVIGERVLVVGQGVVGLLTTALLDRLPLAALIVVDQYERRRQAARRLGATGAFAPADEAKILASLGEGQADGRADLSYELSGSPAALDLAIGHTGFAGRVVIGSWYGRKRAPLDLGGHFHRSHMQLVSSQVSRLHPRWSGRWTKDRRLGVAWEMIRRLRPAGLISHRWPLAEAVGLYDLLDRRPEETLQTIFTYSL